MRKKNGLSQNTKKPVKNNHGSMLIVRLIKLGSDFLGI
jgi:hypothetical protein